MYKHNLLVPSLNPEEITGLKSPPPPPEILDEHLTKEIMIPCEICPILLMNFKALPSQLPGSRTPTSMYT